MMELDKIYNEDCMGGFKKIPQDSVDLTITSPPYDNLRKYEGYAFEFEKIAKELFRVTKQGGVLIWVIGDATIKGNETGTSFKQALQFKESGFNLYDTMIYKKKNGLWLGSTKSYMQKFEYMFVLSKGIPKTINLLRDKKISYRNLDGKNTTRRQDGSKKELPKKQLQEYGIRSNIWEYLTGTPHSTKDAIAYKHPAIFPEQLAEDHILSWSNEGDLVFDPMCGSGTTCKMALINNRKFIGFEISKEYCDIANKRLEQKNLNTMLNGSEEGKK